MNIRDEDKALSGRADSAAGGVEDRDLSADASLLAAVNPTFSWVRLAQRVLVFSAPYYFGGVRMVRRCGLQLSSSCLLRRAVILPPLEPMYHRTRPQSWASI